MSKRIIGIDLGTTNSCVAVWEGMGVTVIENEEGRKTTPSCVSYTPTGKRVGELARRQAAIFPRQTIRSVKRLMGESYQSIKDALPQFSYQVVEDGNGQAVISLDNERITPQEVSANILLKLKNNAEEYLHETITDAVITVPAYFSERQRQATKEAGRIAGLNVLRILNEPTAAAMAYSQAGEKLGNIVVFDLGGGTFDISILHCEGDLYDVKATVGDVHLGGDDIDEALTELLIEEYMRDAGNDVSLDAAQRLRVREAAEEAKIALSKTELTDVSLSWLAPKARQPHLIRYISQETIEQITAPMRERCRELCLQALSKAEVSVDDIDHVLLVGGSTRIPCIRQMVAEIFHQQPCYSQEADEIVAVGAALQGAIISGAIHDKQLLDVTPLSLGLMTQGRQYDEIIAPNTTIPVQKTVRFYGVDKEQTAASILVFQAKNDCDLHPLKIGAFDLCGLLPSEEGVPELDITFDLNQDGILTVKATDLTTSISKSLRIENAGYLSASDVKRIRERIQKSDEEDEYLSQCIASHPNQFLKNDQPDNGN